MTAKIGTVDLAADDLAILETLHRLEAPTLSRDLAAQVGQQRNVVATRLGVFKRLGLVEQQPGRTWQLTSTARTDTPWRATAAREEPGSTRYYEILAKRWPKEPWTTLDGAHGRAAAIKLAREMLDTPGTPNAVVVQGRGTPGDPTPPSEVQVYLGVAKGFNPAGFFPMNVLLGDEVEVRG